MSVRELGKENEICWNCNGSGKEPYESTCPDCFGLKIIDGKACDRCKGEGNVGKGELTCHVCLGKKYL